MNERQLLTGILGESCERSALRWIIFKLADQFGYFSRQTKNFQLVCLPIQRLYEIYSGIHLLYHLVQVFMGRCIVRR